MTRTRLALIAACAAASIVGAAGCGSDDQVAATLPPIETFATTTTTLAPTTTIQTSYVVQPGDTLQKIATKFGVTQADLINLNGLTDPDHIEAGQRLEIPQPGVTITSAPTTSVAGTTAP